MAPAKDLAFKRTRVWLAMSEESLKDSGRALRSLFLEEGGMDTRVRVSRAPCDVKLPRLPPKVLVMLGSGLLLAMWQLLFERREVPMDR